MLDEGPSNFGSKMAPQTTLFGAVEKGRFFKGLPSADYDTGYYAVVELSIVDVGLHSLCV